MEDQKSILDPLSSILVICVNPLPRILRVIVVRTRAGDPRNLRNPVFSQEILRVTVFFGQLAHLGIVQCGEPAVADDRIFLAALGHYREGREQQMDVQVAVEYTVLAGPLLFRRPPQRAEAHVDHARAAPLPFEAAGGMFFDAARTENLRIRADSDLPEVEKPGAGEAGILRTPALFEEIAPRVATCRATQDLDDLPALRFDLHLR